MDLIKEMERVIKEFTGCDTLAANIAANQLLDLFAVMNLELKENPPLDHEDQGKERKVQG